MMNDRSGTMYQPGAQVSIPTFADTRQVLFAAAGGDGADAGYVGQFAARFVLPVPQVDLFLQLAYLPVHFFEVVC